MNYGYTCLRSLSLITLGLGLIGNVKRKLNQTLHTILVCLWRKFQGSEWVCKPFMSGL